MSRLFTYRRVVIICKVESDPSDMAKNDKREAQNNATGVMQGKNLN